MKEKGDIIIIKWLRSEAHCVNDWNVYDGKGNRQWCTITLDMVHKIGGKIISQSNTESVEGLSVTTFVVELPTDKEFDKMVEKKAQSAMKSGCIN